MATIDKLMMLHMAVHNNKMDELKEFYMEKLSFKVTADFAYNEVLAAKAGVPGGSRWISVQFPGSGTSITLTNLFENMKPGGMKLYLSTPDIEAAYNELTAKGVKPTTVITHAGWGTFFSFSDPDGNQWFVVESKN
jgi:predicted enzyme related to lactoylglutathione lyase